jgi:hypothetical protein
MIKKMLLLSLVIGVVQQSSLLAQNNQIQQGILFKSGTSLRIGSVNVLNKRTLAQARSNIYGVFSIPSKSGDTVQFRSDNYQMTEFVVKDYTDQIIFMAPVVQLDEVVIKESSLKSDLKEVQRGYRKKGVFYTGTPHYYYLFLKPMTFIYENFKSEVKDARRFNRYAHKELAASKVSARFNDESIKRVIPITDNELESFELEYMPTLKQIDEMNDYDLIIYIKDSYENFKKNKAPSPLNSF